MRSVMPDHLLFLPQAPKRFMWMSMMMVWSLWSLSAPRWMRALSLFGPRITRLSPTPLAWLLSLNGASKYPFMYPISHAPSGDQTDSLALAPGLCANATLVSTAKCFPQLRKRSCWFSFSSFLIPCRPRVSSSPGPELSSTVPPWRIWAPSPVWSPTLKASPPATRSPRRVSQPSVLASLLLVAWNLIHLLFVWLTSVLKVWGGLERLCILLSVILFQQLHQTDLCYSRELLYMCFFFESCLELFSAACLSKLL